MLEGAARRTRVRRQGRLVELDRPRRASADFGAGPRPTIAVSWGDLATAWRSTRIPEIEVHFEASPRIERAAALPRPLRRLLATRIGQRLAKRQIDRRLPPGPSPERRARTRAVIVAEVWDGAGNRAASRMETPEAYTLTAWTAVEIARRAATGGGPPGYQTPATAFGADFALGFDGCRREDLPGVES
jgi:short subunit dehydrogenase-like uncharacterized protein